MPTHNLQAVPAPAAAAPALITGEKLHDFQNYLEDESRKHGEAAALAFPESTAAVAALLADAAAKRLPVTVSGARTGIAAGAVPAGGLLLSLEKLNRAIGMGRLPDGTLTVRCQSGLRLTDLQQAVRSGQFADSATWDASSLANLAELRARPHFYPPDPTEATASVGGTVACNASGAHSFRHGPTRNYVRALTVVLADGSLLQLERGREQVTADGSFVLRPVSGREIRCQIPGYRMPATKNAAGYWAAPGMDLLDLFVGSEGTLGVITEVELKLKRLPESSAALVVFLPDDAAAMKLTCELRNRRDELGIEAIEYFDVNALHLLREKLAAFGRTSHVPEGIPANAGSAIEIDLGRPAAELTASLEVLAALAEASGGRAETAWCAMNDATREQLRLFRHALPETVNAKIADIRRRYPEVTKLGTDMAVPAPHLEELIQMYRTELGGAGLDFVLFGHIGDSHLHANILPRSPGEYAAGRRLYLEFARRVVDMGGSPAAEHGIGKLKTGVLELLYGKDGVDAMRRLKQAFDPELRLGPGTLFA